MADEPPDFGKLVKPCQPEPAFFGKRYQMPRRSAINRQLLPKLAPDALTDESVASQSPPFASDATR
jgi:hypothetical protein